MDDFYNFCTKHTEISSWQSIEELANRLKTEKEIVVTGLYHRENWNGRAFAWGSPTLNIWLNENNTHNEASLILLTRGDIAPARVLNERFSSASVYSNRRAKIETISKVLPNGDMAVTLNLESNESTIGIKFEKIADEGRGKRKLSAPITGIAFLYNINKISDKVLGFWSQSHLFDNSMGVAHFTGHDNDSVADYFTNVINIDE